MLERLMLFSLRNRLLVGLGLPAHTRGGGSGTEDITIDLRTATVGV